MTMTAMNPSTVAEARWQARVDLAAAFRLCVRYGFHEGIDNHLTLMVPGETDKFYLNPYGLHWSEVVASKLIMVDFDANVVEGDGEAETSAVCIHGPLHAASPGNACVLHTHQHNATALTAIEGGRLEPCVQSALRFYGRAAYDRDYRGVADEWEEGERLVQCLGTREVLFMENHGVMVVGPSVAWCIDALYMLERACELQLKAMSSGRPLKLISDNLAQHGHEQIMQHMAQHSGKHFEAMKRLLDRDAPDYKN